MEKDGYHHWVGAHAQYLVHQAACSKSDGLPEYVKEIVALIDDVGPDVFRMALQYTVKEVIARRDGGGGSSALAPDKVGFAAVLAKLLLYLTTVPFFPSITCDFYEPSYDATPSSTTNLLNSLPLPADAAGRAVKMVVALGLAHAKTEAHRLVGYSLILDSDLLQSGSDAPTPVLDALATFAAQHRASTGGAGSSTPPMRGSPAGGDVATVGYTTHTTAQAQATYLALAGQKGNAAQHIALRAAALATTARARGPAGQMSRVVDPCGIALEVGHAAGADLIGGVLKLCEGAPVSVAASAIGGTIAAHAAATLAVDDSASSASAEAAAVTTAVAAAAATVLRSAPPSSSFAPSLSVDIAAKAAAASATAVVSATATSMSSDDLQGMLPRMFDGAAFNRPLLRKSAARYTPALFRNPAACRGLLKSFAAATSSLVTKQKVNSTTIASPPRGFSHKEAHVALLRAALQFPEEVEWATDGVAPSDQSGSGRGGRGGRGGGGRGDAKAAGGFATPVENASKSIAVVTALLNAATPSLVDDVVDALMQRAGSEKTGEGGSLLLKTLVDAGPVPWVARRKVVLPMLAKVLSEWSASGTHASTLASLLQEPRGSGGADVPVRGRLFAVQLAELVVADPSYASLVAAVALKHSWEGTLLSLVTGSVPLVGVHVSAAAGLLEDSSVANPYRALGAHAAGQVKSVPSLLPQYLTAALKVSRELPASFATTPVPTPSPMFEAIAKAAMTWLQNSFLNNTFPDSTALAQSPAVGSCVLNSVKAVTAAAKGVAPWVNDSWRRQVKDPRLMPVMTAANQSAVQGGAAAAAAARPRSPAESISEGSVQRPVAALSGGSTAAPQAPTAVGSGPHPHYNVPGAGAGGPMSGGGGGFGGFSSGPRGAIADRLLSVGTDLMSGRGVSSGGGMFSFDVDAALRGFNLPKETVDKLQLLLNRFAEANLDAIAHELSESLTTQEACEYFSMYLTLTRVVGETKRVPSYARLLAAVDNPKLYECAIEVTYVGVQSLVGSDQSLRKGVMRTLGAWLGHLTVARSKPILARHLDLRHMLLEGLRCGRLPEIFAFVVNVLESTRESFIFCFPNPWTTAILQTLLAIINIPGLERTLGFDVFLLTTRLNLKIHELQQTWQTSCSYAQINAQVQRCREDAGDSSDFHAGARVDVPRSGAMPALDTAGLPLSVHAPSVPSLAKGGEMHGSEVGSAQPRAPLDPAFGAARGIHAPPSGPVAAAAAAAAVAPSASPPNLIISGASQALFRHDPSLVQMTQQLVERVFTDATRNIVERAVRFGVATASDIAVKDCSLDPDDDTLRHCFLSLATSVSMHHAVVTSRDPLRQALLAALRKSDRLIAAAGGSELLIPITEALVKDSLDSLLTVVGRIACEEARRFAKVPLDLVLADRAEARRREPFEHPTMSLPPGLQRTLTMGRLRPAGALPDGVLNVYKDFTKDVLSAKDEQLLRTLHDIENLAHAHYRSHTEQLSLTQTTFMEKDFSPEHVAIRRAIDQIKLLINNETALGFIRPLLKKVFSISDGIQQLQSTRATAASENHNAERVLAMLNEVCLFALQTGRDNCDASFVQSLTRQYVAQERKFAHKYIAVNFIRLRLLDPHIFDEALAAALHEYHTQHRNGMNPNRNVLDFGLLVMSRCVVDEPLLRQDELRKSMEMINRILPPRANGAPGGVAAAASSAARVGADGAASTPALADGTSVSREVVMSLFRDWIAITRRSNEPSHGREVKEFVQRIQQQRLLKTVAVMDSFFRTLMELAIDAFHNQLNSKNGLLSRAKLFIAVDAFTDLIVLIIRFSSRQKRSDPSSSPEVGLLYKVLSVLVKLARDNHDLPVRTLVADPNAQLVPGATPANGGAFNQAPYVRLFSNLMIALHPSHDAEHGSEGATTAQHLLQGFANALKCLEPSRYPGFAFAWLELLCHRFLMPRIVSFRHGEALPTLACTLFQCAIRFMAPSLRAGPTGQALTSFYRAFLKVIVVIVHDFPEFVLYFHIPLLDVMPPTCVQLRTLILHAMPQRVRAQLPSTTSTSTPMHQLKESAEMPRMAPLADSVTEPLQSIFSTIESWSKGGDVGPSPAFVTEVINTVTLPEQNADGFRVELSAMHALVITAANVSIKANPLASFLAEEPRRAELAQFGWGGWCRMQRSPPCLNLLKGLATEFPPDCVYVLINAIVNQLRYPNLHTLWFANAVLWLFTETGRPLVQDVIARVLLERLVVHLPHQWGLLMVFAELLHNPFYKFSELPQAKSVSGVGGVSRHRKDA